MEMKNRRNAIKIWLTAAVTPSMRISRETSARACSRS